MNALSPIPVEADSFKTPSVLRREAGEIRLKLCGGCSHYGNQDNWSARCAHPAGPPSWTYRGDPIVRRDNSCERFAPLESLL